MLVDRESRSKMVRLIPSPVASPLEVPEGNVNPLGATAFLVRNPATVLKLPRMIRNLSRATTAIADALEAIAHEGKVPKS